MDYTLSLLEDNISPGHDVSYGKTNRVVFVASGSARVIFGDKSNPLSENEAVHSAMPVSITAGQAGATIWRWELNEALAAVARSEEAGTKMVATIQLEAEGEYLMRCDRVDFPLGGVAYTHTHQGPGIRCLYTGEFEVATEGANSHIEPGEAWFESGPDPVYAEASATDLTAFIRVMILPRRLLGQSSIRYVRAEDAEKPKTQRYTMFVDAPIDIGQVDE